MSRRKVVVIGAGAGGLIAAGRAAQCGADVLLLEKMDRPGKKLLLTGNTRCNLTNSCEMDDFIFMYGPNGRFLHRAFRHFFREDLLSLLKKYCVATRQETGGRIFAASGKAMDVVHALEKFVLSGGVTIHTNTAVDSINASGGRVTGVTVAGRVFAADAVVLATGGASYSQTGSNGDGYNLSSSLGHHIVRLRPALVPLVIKDKYMISRLKGLSLQNIRVTSFACAAMEIPPVRSPEFDIGRGVPGRKARRPLIESRKGDVIVTHFGISGPAVLLMSLPVARALEDGPVSISIDLLPDKDSSRVNDDLKALFSACSRQQVHNVLSMLIPVRLADLLLEQIGIPATRKCNQVATFERNKLAQVLKCFSMDISSTRPLAEAMVTAGGVSLDEINPRIMESNLVKGLHFCGEVMDIDADTGGFNLQAAFSTGWLAGESAAALL